MAESLTILERIAEAIVARLLTITVQGGGYYLDVAEVVRPNRTGVRVNPKHLGIMVLQGDGTPVESVGFPALVEWDQTISLDLTIRQPESSSDPVDLGLNRFLGQVVKCLMSADLTWGGLAIRTELGETIPMDGGAGLEGLTQVIHVFYRVRENDPYSLT